MSRVGVRRFPTSPPTEVFRNASGARSDRPAGGGALSLHAVLCGNALLGMCDVSGALSRALPIENIPQAMRSSFREPLESQLDEVEDLPAYILDQGPGRTISRERFMFGQATLPSKDRFYIV